MNIKGFHKLQGQKIKVFGREFRLDLQQTSDTDKMDVWVFESTPSTLSKSTYNALLLTVDFSHATKLPIETRVCFRGRGDEAPKGWYNRELNPPGWAFNRLDNFCDWIADHMEFDLGEDWFISKQ
jgi:hypothetical protein